MPSRAEALPARGPPRRRRTALNAPRILYENVGWSVSSLNRTSADAARLSQGDARSGVRSTRPSMRRAAARMSPRVRAAVLCAQQDVAELAGKRGSRHHVVGARCARGVDASRCPRATRTRACESARAPRRCLIAAIVSTGAIVGAVQIEDDERWLERPRLFENLRGVLANVTVTPACLAVARILDRKRKSSTAARIMIDADYADYADYADAYLADHDRRGSRGSRGSPDPRITRRDVWRRSLRRARLPRTLRRVRCAGSA